MREHIALGVTENGQLKIDIAKLLTTRLLIQANSGGGKSRTLRRLLEQTHGLALQIILDTEGDFHTLREKYDYILAGKGGDCPADPRSAALLARRILEMRVSCIIDLYELKKPERKKFVRLFLDALIEAPRTLWQSALVVVDEAHVYCPEKDEAESAGAVIDLMSLGRKRGFCGVLATQRISKLSKDAAAECNNKLIGRAALDVDMKRAADEIGFSGREQMHGLRTLEAGEFFAFGPAISPTVQKVLVGPVQTKHPEPGTHAAIPPSPPTKKIKAVLAKLADLPKEAEQEARDLETLRRELAGLRRTKGADPQKILAWFKAKELQPADKAFADAAPERQIATIIEGVMAAKKGTGNPDATALQRAREQGAAEARKQIAGQLVAVQRVAKATEVAAGKMREDMMGACSRADIVKNYAGGMVEQIGALLKNPIALPETPPERESRTPVVSPEAKPRAAVQAGQTSSGVRERILNAMAELRALGVGDAPRALVAMLAGYGHIKSHGFAKAISSMTSDGLIAAANGMIQLTTEGVAAAPIIDAPLTTVELHRRIIAVVGGPAGKIIETVVAQHPTPISREDLAQAVGYGHVKSHGFAKALSRAHALGFLEYPEKGTVAASALMFPGDR